MNDFGDYRDEMGRFSRISDQDIDRLLAGKAPVGDETLDELAAFFSEAKGALAQAPAEDVAARQVRALVEASQLLADKGTPVVRPVSKAHGPELQVSGLPKWRRTMDRAKSLTLKLAAGSLAAFMSMFGLAFAGVDLPGTAAEDALEAVLGVELPNQGGDEDETELLEVDELKDEAETDDVESDGPDAAAADVAHEIWNYVSITEDTGCTFGQNVAAIASSSDPTPDEDPCTAGDEGRATGESNAQSGKARGDEGRATGESNAQSGKARGDEGRATGESNAQSGKARGDEGRATGESNAQSGEANGDDAGSGEGDSQEVEEEEAEEDGDVPDEAGADAAESGKANRP